MMKKKILVYPCGTEIGLEIYKSVCNSIHFELYGGSSTYDHGCFVYKKHIENLPFITDHSSEEEISEFNRQIEKYEFDYIYPAMDGVLTVFSKYRSLLSPTVIVPEYETTQVTRSKSKSYKLFQSLIPVPKMFDSIDEIEHFPVFVKPDVGQGSSGALLVKSLEQLQEVKSVGDGKLVLEYLPGEEFTIDCFTNEEGKLIYARGRKRNRIKGGISVNAVFCDRAEFKEIALVINEHLQQKGAWFFQLKEGADGTLKLLEIASRIAGTSGINRNIGVNLPLLTLHLFAGQKIDSVMVNDYEIELDRALGNKYRISLTYDRVYMDYDDTLIVDGRVNLEMIQFLYQCVNKHKEIILITKHKGNLEEELEQYRLKGVFDQVIHITDKEQKVDFVSPQNAIFIDDSYNERRMIKEAYGIPVFDTHMIENLLEG